MTVKHRDALKTLRTFVAEYPTHRDAAAALGLSPAYLSQILNGHTPFSDRVLDKLSLRKVVVSK